MIQVNKNISLLEYNTFGIDVSAETMVVYDSVDDLTELIHHSICNFPKPILHIGEGSNLLFLEDFRGTILRSNINNVDVIEQNDDHVIVQVGAGWNMDDFISYSISKGWYGLENLSKIPGQVGSSAVQNIGAYGVEVGDFIYSVNCISIADGTYRKFSHDECNFMYRHSIFKSPEYRGKYVVTSVEYKLKLDFTPHIDYGGIRQQIDLLGETPETLSAQKLRDIISNIREEKLPDPKVYGNAGSFFMNPIVDRDTYNKLVSCYPNIPKYEIDSNSVKIPAAWLIEQCGWKGKTVGHVGVHPKQPLVLINLGGATGKEIQNMSDTIRRDVLDKFGISIIPEVNFI